MSSTRHTIVTALVGAGLVLAAGSALMAPTAPARLAAMAAPVSPTIATCDTLLVVEAMFGRDDLDLARRTLAEELNSALSAKGAEVQQSETNLQQLLEVSRVRFQSLPEGDPERQAIQSSYQTNEQFHNQRVQALEAMRTESQTRFDDLRSGQLRECYEAVKAGIAAVAAREGYTHVITHSSNQEQFDASGFDLLLQGIRDRGVVVAPAGSDLTDLVLAHLGVERPVMPPEGAMPGADGMGATPMDGTTGTQPGGAPVPPGE